MNPSAAPAVAATFTTFVDDTLGSQDGVAPFLTAYPDALPPA